MQEEELRDLTLSVLTSLTVGVTGYLLHWSAELALQQDPDQGYEQDFLSVPLLFHKHLAFTLVRRIWTFTLVRRICMGYIGLLSGRRVTGIRTEEEDAALQAKQQCVAKQDGESIGWRSLQKLRLW